MKQTCIPLALLVAACAAVPRTPLPAAHLRVHGEEVPFYAPYVLSISDDNSSYLVTLESTVQPGPLDFREIELQCEGWRLNPYFDGDNEHSGVFAFRADASKARTIARALEVSVIDRDPRLVRLVGRLEAVRDTRTGAPRSTLLYTLTNEGDSPAWVNWVEHGGAVPGRASGFTMEIEPDGRPFLCPPFAPGQPFVYPPFEPSLDAQDHPRLGPGESRIFELDPSYVCACLIPGRYTIRATFYTEYYSEDWRPGEGPIGWEEHIKHYCFVTADLAIELP